MPDRRATLREASLLLGVSEGAIRKRVTRGTLRSEIGDDGLRYVWVDTGADGGEDASYTAGEGVRDEMVEDLRDQVAYLRSQLDVRADEIQRRDVIISQLTQATSNLTDRLREIEAPAEQSTPSQANEAGAQDAANGAGGPAPPAGDVGAQNGSERPWWRRVFGG